MPQYPETRRQGICLRTRGKRFAKLRTSMDSLAWTSAAAMARACRGRGASAIIGDRGVDIWEARNRWPPDWREHREKPKWYQQGENSI
jgi:hypothetical protein